EVLLTLAVDDWDPIFIEDFEDVDFDDESINAELLNAGILDTRWLDPPYGTTCVLDMPGWWDTIRGDA
ncbi:MAG: hypothetical protein WBA46_14800, partial [Thermomicrobiales bacterium]